MKLTTTQRLGCNTNAPPTYARPPTPPGPSTVRIEYKVIVAPTREGWRYVPQMRRSRKHPWTDFPPYRAFTTRAEAEQYVEEIS